MSWSPAQIQRLAIERNILDKYFPNRVTWISPTTDTKVEVSMQTNNGRKYKLRIELSEDFPNSCPKLNIVSPTNLKQKNGQLLPENDSTFHTLERTNGCIAICHFYPPLWNAQDTLYEVFMKGRLWLEAYEVHRKSGKTLDEYLPEQVHGMDVLIDLLEWSLLNDEH